MFDDLEAGVPVVTARSKECKTGPARSIFQENWWLDAATDGAWSSVSVERGGQQEGWLPFALTRNMGFSRCGAPPLTRLLEPVVSIRQPKGKMLAKGESLSRARFKTESELIARLPKASHYEFVLSPDHGNALAWQAAGFEARVEHTFVFDARTQTDALWDGMNAKTRNLVRRAEETLTTRELETAEFIQQYRANLGGSVDENHVKCVDRLIGATHARKQGRALGALDREGRIHAAAVFIWDDVDCYYFLSTRNADVAALGAVGLLVWAGIKDAMARGLRFDLDGVSSASRMKFLQSFGGRLANRIIVTRASSTFETRLLLRRARQRLRSSGPGERFY